MLFDNTPEKSLWPKLELAMTLWRVIYLLFQVSNWILWLATVACNDYEMLKIDNTALFLLVLYLSFKRTAHGSAQILLTNGQAR